MHIDDPGRVGCLHLYTEHWGRGWIGMPHSRPLYRKPLGFVLVEFFGDNITLGARVDVGPGHL